ncbi:MAG: type II toxin-antitoxin system HicB family antitoxin [Nanoarchaeota archaeon]
MDKKLEIDIVIVPESDGKNVIYSISSIQFPNVVTQGSTIEQAKARLREALELYFEESPEKKKILFTVERSNSMPLISRMFL